MYKMINEELRIAACRISEIPEEYAEKMKPLETLAIFYDPRFDIVVVNLDNEYYDSYEKLCIAYLDSDYSIRSDLKNRLKSISALTCVKLLDDIIALRERKREEKEYSQIRKILGNTGIGIVMDNAPMIDAIVRNETDFWSKKFLFMYGYIMGKRAERARRKKATV
ncbi:hypothetical protein [Clostridium sp. Marseille-P299]|uniref:hypothetical protein n=1 Tax=Clostridium sp. Marseille-P299 TaxID=1805477 RepID=UPI0008303C4D|nr:hypothetical protein [Clostridium sp. Marseille-P299]